MTEWAQPLRGPPPPDQLQRGHWYPVETRMHDGFVRVLGPNAVGVPIRDSLFRIIDHEPSTVTRVQKTPFGVDRDGIDSELAYYGVCPEGHRIETLRRGDSNVECDQCGQTYDIEDEVVRVQPKLKGPGNETTGDDLGTT